MSGTHCHRKRPLVERGDQVCFRPLVVFLLLLLLSNHPRPVQSSALSVELRPGKRDCIILRSTEGPAFARGSYEILDDEVDGKLIGAWIQEIKSGPTVWKSAGVTEARFDAEMEARKRYAFCLESRAEDGAPIPVGFGVRVQALSKERTLSEEEEGPDAKRALAMVETATKIENDWENLNDHFDYMRNREAVHFKMTEQIFERVMMWTLIEAGLVIVMAVAQVLYWRKFFEQRRYL